MREVWPNAHVSASSEILPEIREFERFSTTALNAYLQPEVSGYLDRLETALKDGGFAGEFMIVQSNGGVMGVDTAARLPVRTALSGPAAGVIAAGYIAEAAGFPDVITGDMGGTVFDVSPDRRGAVDAVAADLDRLRHGRSLADDRDHHDRRGRRLHRLGRQGRAAEHRAGKRRIDPRPRRLWPRATRGPR